MSCLLDELTEEAHVAGVELADFADAVLHHGDAFDAHAESEAGDLFGIVGRLFFGSEGEDGGIDHAASEKLDPSGLLAFAASIASAEDAADLNVGGWLGEGKERREETCFDGRAEERFHGVVERALEVAEGDVAVDAKSFDLMEDRRVGGVLRVIAVDLAGNDDANGRRLQL